MRQHNKAPQQKGRAGAYFKCETCGDEFYCHPSRIRQAMHNRTMIRYCSMVCYDKTGDKNPFHGKRHSRDSIEKMKKHPNRPIFGKGSENPNFVRFGEDFGYLGSHLQWWKRKLIRDIGRCERCGFNETHILQIHHKDRNGSHNERINLELLCPNCHAIEHYESSDGQYAFRRTKKQSTIFAS